MLQKKYFFIIKTNILPYFCQFKMIFKHFSETPMTKVFKFGGTSVGSADNMRRVAGIIQSEGAKLTVLSAMSRVTDSLIQISQAAEHDDKAQVATLIAALRDRFSEVIEELFRDKTQAVERMEHSLSLIAAQAASFQPHVSERMIIAQGELLTTAVFTLLLRESGVNAVLLDAPDFMITDADGQIDTALLKQKLTALTAATDTYYITQGFICTDHLGRIDNLGRGGSDYSAALMGVAIDAADGVQIWTDIDGMHNNDPRIVRGTRPIRRMSFDEAAELAYFGAKILHPATIQPCKDHGIPVYLKNTMDPAAEGTKISAGTSLADGFRAVAAKDGITVVRICSSRMLMAYGFLRKVFEVFEQYKTPIDMITTSEVAVSLTIDNDSHIAEIERDLHEFGTIRIERDNTIVCIVGQYGDGCHGMAARIFDTLTDVPVKMISFGASDRSVALLIDTKHKTQTLQNLNDGLF
jgi:aspartate kinase